MEEIVRNLSSNDEALKWLPQIYHYHILARKVITILLTKNEGLQELVQTELLKK